MKQFKISFFSNGKFPKMATYYREFETVGECKEWARSILSEDSFYCRYTYELITMNEFLKRV